MAVDNCDGSNYLKQVCGVGSTGPQGPAGGTGAPGADGTSPGGADTEIQFNSGDAFGGDPSFIFDYTNTGFTVGAAADDVGLIFSGGGLGIGAIHPNYLLTISGTGMPNENHIRLENSGELALLRLDDLGTLDFWSHGVTAADTAITFRTGTSLGAVSMILSGGKLGIGTTNPTEELQVNGCCVVSGDSSEIAIRSTDEELFYLANRASNQKDSAYLRMKSAGNTTIVFDTSGDSYLTGGNFGIGTNNPTEELHVSGCCVVSGDSSEIAIRSTDEELFYLANRASNQKDSAYLRMKSAGNTTIVFDTSGDSYLTGGNFGIGTNSPTTALFLQSSGTSLNVMAVRASDEGTYLLDIGEDGDGGGVFRVHSPQGKTNFIVSGAGAFGEKEARVGIGRLSDSNMGPEYELHVSGTACISGGAIMFPQHYNATRNALTAVNGMVIYNSGVNEFQGYANDSWVKFTTEPVT